MEICSHARYCWGLGLKLGKRILGPVALAAVGLWTVAADLTFMMTRVF